MDHIGRIVLAMDCVRRCATAAVAGRSTRSLELIMNPARLDAAERLGAALNTLVWGVELGESERNRAAAASFGIARDHHGAMVLLLKHDFHSSSLALLRCLFEAYLRGLWLRHCATDAQVTAHWGGADPPKTMLAEIEITPAFTSGILSRIKKDSWRAMCDFTHTGGLHIQRWQSHEAIEPNFDAAELEQCLESADVFAAMAALELVQMSKHGDDGSAVLRLLKDRWP